MSAPTTTCAKIGHVNREQASAQKTAVKGKHGRSNNLNVYRCERCKHEVVQKELKQ